MSSLSIGKAWDEAKTALQAHRKLIVPIALGMILLPAVIASMVEPQVPAGEQPPAGPWMLVVLAMIIVMLIGQLAMVLLVNGWRESVGQAIGYAARRVPTLILAALMIGIVVILAFSLILAIGMGASIQSGQFDWNNVSAVGVVLLLLAFAALLYFAVRMLPMVAVVASETLGPIILVGAFLAAARFSSDADARLPDRRGDRRRGDRRAGDADPRAAGAMVAGAAAGGAGRRPGPGRVRVGL